MKTQRPVDTPANEERRRFFELSAKYGFSAAMVAGAAGVLTSPEAAAQTAKEETERKNATDDTMTFATAYIIGVSRA